LCITDDADAAQRMRDGMRPYVALYVGGMGAKGKNFYNDVARRYGYEAEAETVQDLYLDGKKDDAAAAIPEEMVRLMSLIGSRTEVTERFQAFAAAGVTTMNVLPLAPTTAERVALVGEAKSIAADL
jgi:alkanesulfonate monooxygenase SsuD/methylene tetrahydromethanopterin reductase-like flavin-dependent oxidoreductase (luciferase family)